MNMNYIFFIIYYSFVGLSLQKKDIFFVVVSMLWTYFPTIDEVMDSKSKFIHNFLNDLRKS